MLTCLAGLALAQAPFTIVRPAEGAKVRERVKVEIPKNSVPPGGYVGLFLNGKFIEAVVPQTVGKYYQYVLDTKTRNLADGKAKIEMVLFVDYNDQPKIVDRSSVNVTIANKANIPMPAAGFRLRYNFKPGNMLTYDLYHRMAVSTISESQNKKGGRAAELPLDSQQLQINYSIDNAYADGDGLLRIYAQPPKGKPGVFLATSRHPNGSYWQAAQFGEMYMRVTSTGNEVFGSVPITFPLEGTNPTPGLTDLIYVLEALPSLPAKPIRPGDAWQTRYQADAMIGSKMHELNSLVSAIPLRGECVGVEWEMGHPCVKVHQSIAAGERGSQGRGDFSNDRKSIDETYWFALDKGQVVKFVVRETIDRLGGVAPGTVATGSGGGAPVANRGAGGGGRAGRGGGRGGGGDAGDWATTGTVPTTLKQQNGPPPGYVPPGYGPPGSGFNPGQNPGQRPAAKPAVNNGPTFIRLFFEDTYVLEG